MLRHIREVIELQDSWGIPALDIRERVALEPKCTLATNFCDNNEISTFFNASLLSFIQPLRVFFL